MCKHTEKSYLGILLNSIVCPKQRKLLKGIRASFSKEDTFSVFSKAQHVFTFADLLFRLHSLNPNAIITQNDIEILRGEHACFSILYYGYFVPALKDWKEISKKEEFEDLLYPFETSKIVKESVARKLESYAASCYIRHLKQFLVSYKRCVDDIVAGFPPSVKLRETVPFYFFRLFCNIDRSQHFDSILDVGESLKNKCEKIETAEHLTLEQFFSLNYPEQEPYLKQRDAFLESIKNSK